MKMKFLSALVLAGGVAFAAFTTTTAIADQPGKAATGEPGKKEHSEGKKGKENNKEKAAASAGAEIGKPAPSFELKDLSGKTVKLADFKGKIVVLEWFNPECPFVVKHHKVNPTFRTLNEEFKSKDVVFLAINSSAKGKQGHGLELNKEKASEFKIEYPILLDESGTVGQAYGARTTPHCFVINKDGVLVYKGAIDDNNDRKEAGKTNYVKVALDAVLAGKPVEKTETRPYGCSVKYGE